MIKKHDIPFPSEFKITEEAVVYIPSGEMGGNHKHPRVECFLAWGEGMTFYWLGENGEVNEEAMVTDEGLKLIVVPSFLPHVVVNHGEGLGLLWEFADGAQVEVEAVEVVGV